MKLIRRNIEGYQAVFFRYKLSGIEFEFSLLSEVASPLQPHFQAMIDDKYPNGVDVVEVENKPYLITVPR
ncbi:MAG: hypothetical protein IM613_12935 [Cytophagales bacterium]|nr:hypothetical protein [Cytophagales bacterium]